jgi:hypothetical protein
MCEVQHGGSRAEPPVYTGLLCRILQSSATFQRVLAVGLKYRINPVEPAWNFRTKSGAFTAIPNFLADGVNTLIFAGFGRIVGHYENGADTATYPQVVSVVDGDMGCCTKPLARQGGVRGVDHFAHAGGCLPEGVET